MSKVLVISGHTDPKNSVVNNEILERLSVALPEVEIVRLADLYTHKPIDVAREQQHLVEADIVVFQFPLFWFSIPSLLQRWIEEVWLHGFSHGSTGTALKGKKLVLSFTVGAPEEVYINANGNAFDKLMFAQMFAAGFTGMEFAGMVHTCSVSYAMRNEPGQAEVFKAKADDHVQRLTALIATL
jgi:general stress protein 14